VLVRDGSRMTCCMAAGPGEGVWRQIVGVVGDVRQGNLDEAPAATIYRPYSQIVEHDMYLVVRTRSEAQTAAVAAVLVDRLGEGTGTAVGALGETRWLAPRSMEQVIADSESIRLRRFVLVLIGSFAGLALVLAAVGLYGVVAYSAAQRTREIGIRVALGAQPRAILLGVVRESVMVSLAALGLGAVAAFAATRFIASMLFGVSAADPWTYLAGAAVMMAVALSASYLPARRAARVDPIVALREP
jgi:putative ABC transport system permease protein